MADLLAVAWAAGLIDGEGCFHISRARPQPGSGAKSQSFSLYLKVAMGHRETLDRLVSIFGTGTIQTVPSRKHNVAYAWLVCSRQAEPVIRAIRPYLVTKAEEADLALAFLALPLAKRGGRQGGPVVSPELLAERERLWDAMRRAKPSFRFRNPDHG